MEKEDLLELDYTSTQIDIRSRTIYARALLKTGLKEGNFTEMWRGDLEGLFRLYDRYYFDGFFMEHLRDRLSFHISDRMTSSGGMTKYYREKGRYEISLAFDLISQTFLDVHREIKVNGIVCHDRLEATMRILEHEMIHLIEFVLYGKSSCSGRRFGSLARNIFGHSGVTHQLVTRTERARKKFNLRVGSKVSFPHDGTELRGTIHRITKRATVFVEDPDGDYADNRGMSYSKYYVPLDHLETVK